MSHVYVFGDEAGNFDFSRGPGASRFFLLTTVTMLDCGIATALLDLRRQLAWDGLELKDGFHATEDRQAVRDRVFRVLAGYEFRIDATILDKPKAEPQIRTSREAFYEIAWYHHLKYVAPILVKPGDELHLIAASLGSAAERRSFHNAIEGVVKTRMVNVTCRTAFWPAAVDPCIQVADYCSWAVQRKWEKGDCRSYDLIQDKIRSEYDVFERGTRLYY